MPTAHARRSRKLSAAASDLAPRRQGAPASAAGRRRAAPRGRRSPASAERLTRADQLQRMVDGGYTASISSVQSTASRNRQAVPSALDRRRSLRARGRCACDPRQRALVHDPVEGVTDGAPVALRSARLSGPPPCRGAPGDRRAGRSSHQSRERERNPMFPRRTRSYTRGKVGERLVVLDERDATVRRGQVVAERRPDAREPRPAAQRRHPVPVAAVDRLLRRPQRRERLAPGRDVGELRAHHPREQAAAAVRGQHADHR